MFFTVITIASLFIIIVNISEVIKDDDDRDNAINFAFVMIGVLLVTQQWLTWMYLCECLESDRDRLENKAERRRRAWEREDAYWAARNEAMYDYEDNEIETDYLPWD